MIRDGGQQLTRLEVLVERFWRSDLHLQDAPEYVVWTQLVLGTRRSPSCSGSPSVVIEPAAACPFVECKDCICRQGTEAHC